MATIKEFVEALSSSWPAALTALIGSGAVLVGDIYELQQLRALPNWAIGVAYIVASFSAAILFVTVIRACIEIVAEPFKRKKYRDWQAKHISGLSGLPPSEGYILVWALAHGTQVIAAPYFNTDVKALVVKGYLLQIPGSHDVDKMTMRIPDHIWNTLRDSLADGPIDISQFAASPFSRW